MKLAIAFALVLTTSLAGAQNNSSSQLDNSVAAGKRTYLQYCAACHGPDGRGTGPAASALRQAPADLTALAKTHGGKFPDEYVIGIIRFGKPFSSHGSSDMPVWGPVFTGQDHGNVAAVNRRIKNLCDYLKTIQEKES